MRRQHLFITLAALAILLVTSAQAFAQSGELRGKVTTKGADGKEVPVMNAIVDIYRVDMKAKYETKTDKKGGYVYAGLPFIGTYIVAVSAPSMSPTFLPNIKLNTGKDVNFIMEPGDGKRASEEEVMAAANAAAAGGTADTAEDRAKRAEMEKKNAAIAEGNKKIEASNALYVKAANEGTKAFNDKRYDEAITIYNAALDADPDHPGAPVILTNRSIVQRVRGVDRYNAAARTKDEAGIAAGKKDWSDAVVDAQKAVEMLKKDAAPADPQAAANYKKQLYNALLARSEAMFYFVAYSDKSKSADGVVAYQEYIAVETDPAKKVIAEGKMARMLFEAGEYQKSIEAYQKVLTANPDEPDALLYTGLALFNSGDKAKYQEAANFLQRFVDKAQDTHPLKADARAVLEALKQEKVTPQKGGGTTRRRG